MIEIEWSYGEFARWGSLSDEQLETVAQFVQDRFGLPDTIGG